MRPAPMKVWVAKAYWVYCHGFGIIGIYANESDAETAGREWRAGERCDWYEIEEFEVQDA